MSARTRWIVVARSFPELGAWFRAEELADTVETIRAGEEARTRADALAAARRRHRHKGRMRQQQQVAS